MATPANKALRIDALLQKHMIAERKIVKKHLMKFPRFQSKLHVQNSAMPAPLTKEMLFSALRFTLCLRALKAHCASGHCASGQAEPQAKGKATADRDKRNDGRFEAAAIATTSSRRDNMLSYMQSVRSCRNLDQFGTGSALNGQNP